MKQISRERYVEGVESIYVEQPAYQEGCDGKGSEKHGRQDFK